MGEAFRVLNIVLALGLWPATVLAAGGSLGSTMGAVTLADWVAIVALSTVSGAVSLLRRVRLSFEYEARVRAGAPGDEADRQMIDWRIYGLSHMTAAIFVGFVAFLIGQWQEWNPYLVAFCIALASWTGAKVADMLAQRLTESLPALPGPRTPTP